MTAPDWVRRLESAGGVGEQFGYRVQIPVGRCWVDVPEPGRQQWEACLDVVAVAVPVEHCGHSEGVSQVVESGRPVPGLGRDTGSGDDLVEGAAQAVRVDCFTPAVHEEAGAGPGRGPDPVPANLEVVAQDRGSGRVEEHEPGLAELGLQDLDDTIGQVHVGQGQVACLTGSHPCGCEQTDQRPPGRRPEPWGQGVGPCQEREDLSFAEHIRFLGPVTPRTDCFGRDLGGGIQRLLIPGEDPYRVHPAGKQGVSDGNLDRRGRPLDREVVVNTGGAACLTERDEVEQQFAQAFHLEAHRPAHGQVVVDVRPERAHGRAPGQGRARPRAASTQAAARGAVPGHGRAKDRSAPSSTLA